MATLGKYEQVEEIGRGGFGVVYKAVDPLDRPVALKLLQTSLLSDPVAVQRFEREARVAARLRHENIVLIYEIAEFEGSFYIAMEYLDGQSLDKLIGSAAPLALEKVGAILAQIGAALDFAHTKGVIHRDVKPSNIIVSPEGHATLTDFGLVKVMNDQSLSMSMVVGTPEFMAPEQAEPRPDWPQDGRIDVYALGMVCYQMITGKSPYNGDTPLAVFRAKLDRSVPEPSSMNPGLPRALDPILQKALARNPTDRFTTAGEFARAFTALTMLETHKTQQVQQLAEWYEDGLRFVKNQNWLEAVTRFAQVVNEAPTYRDAAVLLQQAAEKATQERERLARLQTLRPLYEQAMSLYGKDEFDQALVCLDQLLAQDNEYPQVQDKRTEISKARDQWLAERKAHLDKLYAEIASAIQQARQNTMQLLAEAPEFADPRGLFAVLNIDHPVDAHAPVSDKDPDVNQSPTELGREIPAISPNLENAAQPPKPAKEPEQVIFTVGEAQRQEAPLERNELVLTLTPDITIELVHIPAGEFLMGSADGDIAASDNEKPQHKVMLDEYWIGRYDITNAQFAAFVKATGYKTAAEKEGSGYIWTGSEWKDLTGADWQHPKGPQSNMSGKDKHPVVQVSWEDAMAFCAWVEQVARRKVKLPSEAQWEKAARGADGRLYPWGNGDPDVNILNCNGSVGDTTEVGKYSPVGGSPYRAADMAGNVWQWTSSLYEPYPYNANDGREDQSSRGARVLRGGSFVFEAGDARSAYRYDDDPYYRYVDIGFRVVVSAIS